MVRGSLSLVGDSSAIVVGQDEMKIKKQIHRRQQEVFRPGQEGQNDTFEELKKKRKRERTRIRTENTFSISGSICISYLRYVACRSEREARGETSGTMYVHLERNGADSESSAL